MLSLIKEKWNDILEQMKIENDISEVAFYHLGQILQAL